MGLLAPSGDGLEGTIEWERSMNAKSTWPTETQMHEIDMQMDAIRARFPELEAEHGQVAVVLGVDVPRAPGRNRGGLLVTGFQFADGHIEPRPSEH